MRTRCLLFSCFLLLVAAPTARAQGAIALTFNTSARAEGVGGAGVANVWGGDTDVWANPALLAFRPGVRFGTMHSQLAVGLADNIFIDKQELTLGYAGIGVLYGGAPLQHVHLDMGLQQGVDENGQPTGTFQAWEKTRAWGVGVGLTQVLDHLRGTDVNSWFDVAGGVVWRRFEDRLAPDAAVQDSTGGGGARASSHDLGWVARFTPVNTLERGGGLRDAPVGLVLEASYGWAKQNGTDDFLRYPDTDQSDPLPTAYVKGWSVHAELVSGREPADGLPWLLRGSFSPLFAWTYSSQTIEPGTLWNGSEYVYEHDTSGLRDEESHGHEFVFLNVLYLRRGHVTMTYGGIDDDTTGWGVNLQAGRFGGVRYDKATVPQATGLPKVERSGWHLWVDLAAILAER